MDKTMMINSAGVHKTISEVHRKNQPELELKLQPFMEAKDTTYRFTQNIPGIETIIYEVIVGNLKSLVL